MLADYLRICYLCGKNQQTAASIMYYGHLNHKQFENRPDFSHYNYQYHGTEGGFIPTIIFAMILIIVVVASFVSYKSTERVAPNGSHIHWTWFGKHMIYEYGQHHSYYYMHPKSCPICKEILYKIKEPKRYKQMDVCLTTTNLNYIKQTSLFV